MSNRQSLGCLAACAIALALIMVTPRVGHTQLESQIIKVQGDTITVSLIPSVVLDEQYLANTPHYTAELPDSAWNQARECFSKLPGVHLPPETKYFVKPALLVIPRAAAIIVKDVTIDGIRSRMDSTDQEKHWSNPAFAYALMHSRAIAIVERYKDDLKMLRHESLHFWTWYYYHELGHPSKVFGPCDQLFKE